jgi:hypothetical protein
MYIQLQGGIRNSWHGLDPSDKQIIEGQIFPIAAVGSMILWQAVDYSKQPLVVLRTNCVILSMYCYMRNLNRQEVDLLRKFTDPHSAYSEWVLYGPVSIIRC